MYLKNMLASIAMAAVTANATTVYFDNGDYYELTEGEELYVSKGRVWEFTRFQADDLRIQSLEPIFDPSDQCSTGLTFGGSSCTTSEPVETNESDECDVLTFGGGSNAC
jgi:hypothetical protein